MEDNGSQQSSKPTPACAITSLVLFLAFIIYNLHIISTRVSEAFSNLPKSDQSLKYQNPFGETDITYSQYVDLQEIKGESSYGHVTIKGRLKNNGSKEIKNCALKITIYDKNNNMLHTDKIHIFGDVGPGELKSFQSMTLWPKSAKTFNLKIDELRVK